MWLALAAALIRRGLDMNRLEKLSGKMEDYLTGHCGRLPISLKEDRIAQVENAAAEMQNRIEVAEERYRLEFVDPRAAIEKNRRVKGSPYNPLMFEREARVLELLISEGLIG